MEDFEGNRPVVPEIAREIHSRHATAPELALERIATGKAGLERSAEVGAHADPETSFWNRGFFRSGSSVGSIRSQAGER